MSSTQSATLKITPFVREYCGCSMLSWNRLFTNIRLLTLAITLTQRPTSPSCRDIWNFTAISRTFQPGVPLFNALPLFSSSGSLFLLRCPFFCPTARPHRLQWGGWQSNVLRDCSFSVLFPFDFPISSYAGTTQHASRLTRPPAIPLAKTKGVLWLSG